jgi:phosphoglycerate dehydrogenase-like enzyme
MNERLVLLRDSFSLLDVPAALELLQRHGMRAVKAVPPESRDQVVAIVAGLQRFCVADATDFPALRTVARFGAGCDNIDVNGLWSARQIAVSYTPNVSSGEVAELAFAMIILTLRGAPRDIAGLAAERAQWRVIGRGVGLSDATVGIVGCGHIGLATARLVAPLAARVLLWNRSKRPVSLPDTAEYELVDDLHELAARCDVISVHVALTPGSERLIGREFFDAVRASGRSIALVNTARGDVVDEEALLEALETHIVRAAAIDVWSLEGAGSIAGAEAAASVADAKAAAPSSPGATPTQKSRLRTLQRLRQHPAVLATSHIGAFTTGVLERGGMQCARNIIAVVAGAHTGISGHIALPTG